MGFAEEFIQGFHIGSQHVERQRRLTQQQQQLEDQQKFHELNAKIAKFHAQLLARQVTQAEALQRPEQFAPGMTLSSPGSPSDPLTPPTVTFPSRALPSEPVRLSAVENPFGPGNIVESSMETRNVMDMMRQKVMQSMMEPRVMKPGEQLISPMSNLMAPPGGSPVAGPTAGGPIAPAASGSSVVASVPALPHISTHTDAQGNQFEVRSDPTTGRILSKTPVGAAPLPPKLQYFLNAHAALAGKTVEQLTPEERISALGAYQVGTSDPALREAALAQKALAMSMQQMQLNQMPKEEDAKDVAKAMVEHRMAPDQVGSLIGGFGAQGQAFKRMIMKEALKVDPQFDFEQASADYTLSKSPQFQQQIRFLDHVKATLPRLSQAAERLGNTNIQLINKAINEGKKQLGGVNIIQFNTDKELVANELSRVLAGGGTGSQSSDFRLKQAESLITSAQSPAQIKAAIEEIGPILKSRRETLTRGTYLAGVDTSTGLPTIGSVFQGQKVLKVEKVQ